MYNTEAWQCLCVSENRFQVRSLKTAGKATCRESAREVTKAYSVISNRVGIRERSVFWGTEVREGWCASVYDWLVRIVGGYCSVSSNEIGLCGAPPAPRRTLGFPSRSMRSGRSNRDFFTQPGSYRKINGHFVLRRVAGSGRGGNTIYLFCRHCWGEIWRDK